MRFRLCHWTVVPVLALRAQAPGCMAPIKLPGAPEIWTRDEDLVQIAIAF
jgi:hypothetical protein